MTKERKPTSQPLKVEIDESRLVISIGVSTLAYAAQNCPTMGGALKVTDPARFARAVRRELMGDDEIGTPVQKMLDQAFEDVIELDGGGFIYDEQGL